MTIEQKHFKDSIQQILDSFSKDLLLYNKDEFWMIEQSYELIANYAFVHQLPNTSIALPLARGLHNGSYRKSSFIRNGQTYHLPYYSHCLVVCKMLLELNLPLDYKEIDIILASCLCHDMIEDLGFPKKGKEIYEDFHLDKKVYDTVKLVSKRSDFTEEEEIAFFHGIESNPYALLVKLSDRGHNVEDLYNMKTWKVREYIGETRKFFIPMSNYGLEHYPNLRLPLIILKDKIVLLTEAAESLVQNHEDRMAGLNEQLKKLREENDRLKKEWISIQGDYSYDI